MVLAPFAVAAVVRALATVPVVTFEPLIPEIPPPAPLTVVKVPTLAVKDPLASRATMVEAPFAEFAVVRALDIVPVEMLLALMSVRPDPLPLCAPEIVTKVPTLAAKDPLESLATIVEAPLAEAAEVLALSKVPAVIAEALIAVMAAPLPEKDVPVIAPAANSPEAPRRTIVEAPLAVAAVVLAFAIVPEAMLEALRAVRPIPFPDTEVNVPALAVKLPPESRATIVDAPFAEAAVVRALSIVPDEMFEALIAESVAPLPLNVAVIMFAPKLPLASRSTSVDALFAVFPVVRALAIVPEAIFEALIAVKATPLPDTLVNAPVVPLKVVAFDVVAVMVLAVNDPVESRSTIVLAPFAEAAVVLSFANVPSVMLEALIETFAALVNCP
jgi:hypothetical protein